MKIRSGFVSNSSSSSFVTVLPIGFDPHSYDFSILLAYQDEQDDKDLTNEKVAIEMNKMIKRKINYFYDCDINYLDVIEEALDDVGFKVASTNTGPDEGTIGIVKGERIMEFLTSGCKQKNDKSFLTDNEIGEIIDKVGAANIITDAFKNR